MRGADVGPRRHRRDIGRDGQNEAGRCGARARRADEHATGVFAASMRVDDVARRVDQTARRRSVNTTSAAPAWSARSSVWIMYAADTG